MRKSVTNAYRYCHRDSNDPTEPNAHGDRDGDSYAKSYSNAQASPDAASAIVLQRSRDQRIPAAGFSRDRTSLPRLRERLRFRNRASLSTLR